jgi:putative transposase
VLLKVVYVLTGRIPGLQEHYNTARPHQGIGRRMTDPNPARGIIPADLSIRPIRRKPVLGGLINKYERAA